MKKYIYLILSIIILGISNTYAYNTKTYEIDIPNNYKESKNQGTWEYSSKDYFTTISIIVDNNKNKLNFEDYNEDEIEKNEYIEELKDNFKKLNDGINVSSTYITFTKINNLKAIKMDVESNYTEDKKYNSLVYQTEYVIASEKYVYYIILSSSQKENLTSSEINNMLDSFEIKDDEATKDKSMTKYYLSIAIVIASSALALSISIKKKHSK